MPIEIERKFLLADPSWRAQVQRSQPMRQGYLSRDSEKASVRVRVEGETARLNIKAAVVGSARAEYDYAVPVEHAREILDQLCVGRVEKVRHYIQAGELLWEIDEFGGDNAGLVVAEVELERADQPLTRPAWLGLEVTDDRRYYNHYLALHPYRSWPAG